jgi:type IV pilus assembly protein PilQ
MNKWNKATAGVLLMAIASVYADRAIAEDSVKQANPVSSSSVPVSTPNFSDPFASTEESAPIPVVSESGGRDNAHVVVAETGVVEVHANEASLAEVLRMLSLQSQKNIVASKEVRGNITANLYGVTLREALDALLHSNGFAYREKGNFIFVYSAREIQEMEKANRVASTEVFRLNYANAADVAKLILPVLSKEAGQVAMTPAANSGITTGVSDVGGNSFATEDLLVVTDYAENLDRVRELIKEIDKRPQQVLIEATILRASLSEDNALGIDFNMLCGVDFSTVNGSGFNGSFNNLVDGSIVNTEGSGGFFDRGMTAGRIGGSGLQFGVLTNNISLFITALEGITDTVVLANPKVLALNKQKGEVIVGREDGYITTTVTESTSVQTVEFLKTGSRLIFRPFIGSDNYIRMEIHPEDSSGGLTSANLPFKITTEVTSNIMVKDGHTIVIGGLFREASDTARSQTPFLGSLPGAGPLFRKQRDRSTREEVIILLTPHIIKDDRAYADASEEQLRLGEQLRVGVRRGMMPTGRERMAEIAYEIAMRDLNQPEPNREGAKWWLDCATNLNPKFIEAIELKRQLTGEEITTVDNSSIRAFVRRQIMRERAMGPSTMPTSNTEQRIRISPRSPDMPAMVQPTTQPLASHDVPAPTPAPTVVVNDPPPAPVRGDGFSWNRLAASWKSAIERSTGMQLAAFGWNEPSDEGQDSTAVLELPESENK